MSAKKKILLSLIVILAVFLITAGGFFIYGRFLTIDYDSTESAILSGSFTITRDAAGIPQIDADNRNDLYFALGYIHSKDRLNLMEYHRAIAIALPGRIIKKDSEPLIKLSKSLGFTKEAEDLKRKLSDHDISYIKSYCDGINHIRKRYKIRGMLKREWKPEDVLSVIIMREWTNSYLNNQELLINLEEGKILPDIFRNRYVYNYSEENLKHLKILRRLKELIRDKIGPFNRGYSVSIDKKLTTEGSTAALYSCESVRTSYPDWYPVNIVFKGRRINAITCTGMPFLFLFKTEKFTFTNFNLNTDTQDFYLFNREYKGETALYRGYRGLREFESVRIPVFSSDENLSFHINWITDKGPVITELFDDIQLDDRVLSVKSVMPGPGYIRLMINAPFTENIPALSRMIKNNDSAPKCFMITDNRNSYEAVSGKVIESGRTSYVFKRGEVYTSDRFSGFYRASSFNSGVHITGSGIIEQGRINSTVYRKSIIDNVRMLRLKQLLPLQKVYDENRIASILNDSKSIIAEKMTPVFTSMLEQNPLTSSRLSRIYFSDWNYLINHRDIAPTLFYTMLNFFMDETLSPVFGPDRNFNNSSYPLLYKNFADACRINSSKYFDNPETDEIETREKKFDAAFLKTIRTLSRKSGPLMEQWTWGSVHKGSFIIPNQNSNFFSGFSSIKDIPFPGGPDTIQKSSFSRSLQPLIGTSVKGYFDKNNSKIEMDFSISTSELSDFYYGKTGSISQFDMNKTDIIHKSLIE